MVLEPRSAWSWRDLGELWSHRELVFFLAQRDIKVRYKQTALGAAWALLQPLLTMAVFSVFFGRLARVGSDGAPYPLFVLCALVPWQLFSFALTQSSNSLVTDQSLLRKVYFPRLALPLAASLGAIPDFLVSVCALLIGVFMFGGGLGWRIALLPFFACFALFAALAIGIWLSALNVKYRDFRYTVPFLIQVWMFASPVAYSSSLVPERWRWVYSLNPMATVVDGFRWALLGSDPPTASGSAALFGTALIAAAGYRYFRTVEGRFSDVV